LDCLGWIVWSRATRPRFSILAKKAAISIAAFLLPAHERSPSYNTRQNRNRKRILTIMDKKEIESPKLTARFLIWITGFMIVLFALIAHFVWRIF
jgi:L-ribulose-5-phosphate 3-epimerase UlaE